MLEISPWCQPIQEWCTSWSHTLQAPPSHCLWNPNWGVWVFWAWAAHSPCLVPCNKSSTFLHHNLVSVAWLYCMWASRPKFGSVTCTRCCTWEKAVMAWPLKHRKLVAFYLFSHLCFLVVYWPFLDTHALVNTKHALKVLYLDLVYLHNQGEMHNFNNDGCWASEGQYLTVSVSHISHWELDSSGMK